MEDLRELGKKNNIDIYSSINIDDVYVDPTSGESHLCGEYCTARYIDNSTDTMVCPISGKTFPIYVIEDQDKEVDDN